VKAENTEINSRAGVRLNTAKGRINSSTSTNANLNKGRKKKQGKRRRKQSEA